MYRWPENSQSATQNKHVQRKRETERRGEEGGKKLTIRNLNKWGAVTQC